MSGTGCLEQIYCFDVVEHITTPHFSCANAHTDPTHKHHFAWRSFDYFTADHGLRYYSAARWPDWYEHRLAWICPAWYLEFELVAER